MVVVCAQNKWNFFDDWHSLPRQFAQFFYLVIFSAKMFIGWKQPWTWIISNHQFHSSGYPISNQISNNTNPVFQTNFPFLLLSTSLTFLSSPYLFPRKDWTHYKVRGKKMRHIQNQPLIKDPQFFFNPHETLWKWLSQEVIIFTKFHEDRTKKCGSFINGNFWTCLGFFSSDFR